MPIYYIFKGIFSDIVFDKIFQHPHLLMVFLWIFFFKGWLFMMANLVILI